MSRHDLDEIVSWRYQPPYDFYDGDQEEPLNPERYFAARDDDGSLIGFYYFDEKPIKVYERAGFRETGRHLRTFERFGAVEFVEREEAR